MNDPPARLLLSTASGFPPYKRWRDRKLFGYPIQFVFFVSGIVCTVLDIVQVLLAIAAYFYPIWFRRTPLYRQIFHKTDRHFFHTSYTVALIIWAMLFFVHILSIGMSILSIQMRRPPLFLPQLGLLLTIVLAFLAIFAVSSTISVVGDHTMLSVCVLSLIFLLLYWFFLGISVLSFQNLLGEYEEIQRILAKAKTVHFKEKKRKK